MRAAMSQLNLLARAYHRILKLARTITDLAESKETQSVHLAEVLQYRPKLMIDIIDLLQKSAKVEFQFVNGSDQVETQGKSLSGITILLAQDTKHF
jgi:hypothetical protein